MRTATILKGELNEFSSDSSGHSRCFLAWGGFSIPGAKKTLLTRLLSLLLSTASAAPILGLFNVKHGFGSRTSRRTACQSLTLHTGFHPANTRAAPVVLCLKMHTGGYPLTKPSQWPRVITGSLGVMDLSCSPSCRAQGTTKEGFAQYRWEVRRYVVTG